MGYFLTTDLENAVPGKFLASPKTHTPLSRLQERGQRFHSPGVGRWINRDPIGESDDSALSLQGFVGNNPFNNYDMLGLMTYGFQRSLKTSPSLLRDSQPSYRVDLWVALPPVSAWPQPLPQRVWQLNHWVDIILGVDANGLVTATTRNGDITDNFYAKVGGQPLKKFTDHLAGVKPTSVGLTVCMLVHTVEKKIGWNASVGALFNTGTHGNTGGPPLEPGVVQAMKSGMRVDDGATLTYNYIYANNKDCPCQHFWQTFWGLPSAPCNPAQGKIIERLDIPGVHAPWQEVY